MMRFGNKLLSQSLEHPCCSDCVAWFRCYGSWFPKIIVCRVSLSASARQRLQSWPMLLGSSLLWLLRSTAST